MLKKINLKLLLQIFICFALLSRLFFVNFPSFGTDMGDYMAWTGRLVSLTPWNFYSANYFSDYFPGYLYILWLVGGYFSLLAPNLSFSGHQFEIYLKLVNSLFDFGTAYLIYKIVKLYKPNWSSFAALLYLVNPVVIFNSTVWGQSDGVYTFFLVLATYFLIELKKSLNWSFWMAVSILVKPQSIAVIPLAVIYQLKLPNHHKKLFQALVILPMLLIVLALPFTHKDPFWGLYHLGQTSTQLYPFTSEFAYNLWGLFGWWKSDATKIFITYQIWGILLFGLSILTIIIPIFLKKTLPPKQIIYLGMALSLMAFFLFVTRVHERYLFPFFAFMLIAAATSSSKRLVFYYIVLSLIHFFNIWYVYYYYNFVYSHPAWATLFPYSILNQPLCYTSLIITSLFLFALLLYEYYHRLLRSKLNV